MKALFIIMAIILSFRFVYHLVCIGAADIKGEYGDLKTFIATLADAILIIAFAILEKGRW